MRGAFFEIRLSATVGNRWVVSGVHADEESEAAPDTLRLVPCPWNSVLTISTSLMYMGGWRWSSIHSKRATKWGDWPCSHASFGLRTYWSGGGVETRARVDILGEIKNLPPPGWVSKSFLSCVASGIVPRIVRCLPIFWAVRDRICGTVWLFGMKSLLYLRTLLLRYVSLRTSNSR
jgi:hypothetical protein